jgi:hypothetical protein
MARYGTVFFTDAVCGAWTVADREQFALGPSAPPPRSRYYERHFPTRPYLITDSLWNYVLAPIVTLPKGSPAPQPPPVGPSNVPGLLYTAAAAGAPTGAAVSAGQVIANGVVMCKYVYPMD